MTMDDVFESSSLFQGLTKLMGFTMADRVDRVRLWEHVDAGNWKLFIDDGDCVVYTVDGEVIVRASREDILEFEAQEVLV